LQLHCKPFGRQDFLAETTTTIVDTTGSAQRNNSAINHGNRRGEKEEE
jgi:hypothetical protein